MAALGLFFLAAMGLLTSATVSAAAAVPRPEAKPSDTDALTMFRLGADAHGILANNWTTPDACAGRWAGVGCSPDGRRVTSLALPSLDLRGPLDPLAHLASLRALDLRGNRLNGTLRALFLGAGAGAEGLQLLYLSSNDLSGNISGVARLSGLTRLDLADNSFSGPVSPEVLANLTGLLTLKLQDNLFAGLLPDVATILPRLAEFNASNNRLSGRVPDAVRARFGLASLAGNAGLCGLAPPLPACSFLPPREPAPTSPSQSSVVPSNPAASSSSSSVAPAALATPEGAGASKGAGLSAGAIAGIAVGNALFLLALLSLLLAYCCCISNAGHGRETAARKRNRVGLEDADGDGIFGGGHGKMQPARPGSATGRCSDDSDGARSKLVFFGDNPEAEDDSDSSTGGHRRTTSKPKCKFELDELLRASAEMVGRGSLGTVYRAALPDGRTVAVKRLRDANPCGRDEFRRYMDLIGRLRHPNLVPLRAFYYAKQEKLLVYDYFPGSSLHRRLHPSSSSPAPAPAPLGWASRVRLLLGAARGLACIHGEYRGAAIPHGNVKSTNVLLLDDERGGVRAMVADFGLALLLSPAHAVARLGGYTAPEQRTGPPRLSQEADVYGFGVLILEALTGRVPAAQEDDGRNEQRREKRQSPVVMSLPEWVRSVVREEWTAEVFDVELLRERGVEEEMVAVLHVALACVAEAPAQRPAMADVVRMLESVPVDDPEEEEGSVSLSGGVTTEDDALSY
ncbi:leucine-rich repeat receptor-like protein kinase PXC1 [Brachypodium distachyon]|uniref:Protein kinase domain-containing protein n=1 Tax=Brachypodium distachyon TaxID=15368 RepID=I1IUF9_BRADI|nr:leucine-rich repeat receptor-like protein kinase PXC1 [Brachypodium distachyon]PNT65460.1 hypothetical protein BRADI_4g42800v3 [Brachypodium distachyon]|eukprot:XP_003577060.1 leucine-rich repeat receptor-like protein kinase PXC1 [Brachypodium distachyon]